MEESNPPTPPRRRREPAEPVVSSEVAPTDDDGGLLAGMHANMHANDGGGPDLSTVLSALIDLRSKPVDPMTDYVSDATRVPRFIRDAVRHEAEVTPLSQQEIMRDALLGIRPLSKDLLDAHYLKLYGRRRETH